jgi:hypothetical protein
MPLNLKDLRLFLVESITAGYAGLGESGKKNETDGSKTFSFQKGAWKSHDNYFGGEPFGGRTVVFYNDKPVWMMVYYGSVGKDITNFAKLYEVLQKALLLAPEQNPYRGPESFKEDDFEYKNTWVGEVDNFSGEEVIMHQDVEIYRAKYLGGLVNVRED